MHPACHDGLARRRAIDARRPRSSPHREAGVALALLHDVRE